MLLAAGPTMLVRVMATLIWVFETPVTPLAAGHPGAAAPPPPPEAAAVAVPPFAVVPAAPLAPVAPAADPPVAPCAATSGPTVPPVAPPAPASAPCAPPPDARFVDLAPDPGTSSQARRITTRSAPTPALMRSVVGALRAQNRNSC